MAAVKYNCLYIFKTRYLEVCILNILLLDLDRHSHPPFLKMAAVLINVAITYVIATLINTAAIFKYGGCECRSRSRSNKIFKISSPIYVYIEKVSV